jgi:protein-disulfide isomerase
MPLSPPAGANDHLRGDLNAPLILVQYGDFECPYSGAAYGVIKDILANAGDRIGYVFRSFPLADIHPHAQLASQAAEAAGEKFWEMHDLLFENQKSLQQNDLLSFATELGLEPDAFQIALHSPATIERVRASVHTGQANGVHGTPTFFINGEFHDNTEGLWKKARLLKALETALA